MKCLISVIIPVYRVEQYLIRCVESVLSQTYSNIEIILVDDGSPDTCPELCDQLAELDIRIKVIHKANGGLSDARNTGIENSQGEYILFVDSDDYLDKEMIERLYCAIKSNNTKMALCNFLCVDVSGNPTGESENSPIVNEVLEAKEVLERFYQSCGWFYIVAWNKLYHRSLVSHDVFPVGKIHEDEFTAAQLIWKAERVACIQYYGYYYVRQRVGSIMQINNGVKHLDICFALIERYKFYQSIGCTHLLYETQARVYEVLKDFYCNETKYDELYKKKIMVIQNDYEKLLGVPLMVRFKLKLFKSNPKLMKRLEHYFI